MAFCEDKYYKRIGFIQQSIHEREKRRLELEGELFAYSRSDKRISQIKSAKLCGYLKEICEREKRAKMRNLELLKDVECMEMSLKDHYPDRGLLHQHKTECLNRISTFMLARGKKELERDTFEADKGDSYAHPQDASLSHLASGFYQPAAIFMGRQTSRGTVSEDATTSVHLHRASHRSPNHRSRSSERPQSGLLKDSKVSGELRADSRARLSDDISGSNDSPDGCNLSDKHERTVAVVPSVRALTAGAGVPFGGDEQPPSPKVTLRRPEKNTPSPSSIGPVCDRNSPAEHTQFRGSAHQELIMEDMERGPQGSAPEKELGIESQEVLETCESVSLPSSSVDLSVTSGSDLSISLTESDLEELPEGVVQTDSPPGQPERSTTPRGSDLRSTSVHSHASLGSAESNNRPESIREATSPETPSERLSMEGFFNLLGNIEGRLHGEETNLYRDSSASDRKRSELISLCNAGAALNGEDLGACGAVVLHQLQRLSWSMSKGCLLPEEIVSTHCSTTKPMKISSSLPRDAAPLWDRWFKHALLLKDHHVLSTERLVQLFSPLLLEQHASYSQKAKVLLRTLLSRSSEELPSATSESSSCSLISLLDDGTEVRPARAALDPRNAGTQGVQSGEEDSQEESLVESIPNRETKAYQLLKQSATQQRPQSSKEEEGLSGVNDDHEEDMGRVERSSHPGPYPGKGQTKTKGHSAIQSKAFWGESDDSDSEIEAALRPQTFTTDNDDFDDFYD